MEIDDILEKNKMTKKDDRQRKEEDTQKISRAGQLTKKKVSLRFERCAAEL